jgi:hypothetical protein
MGVQSVYGVVCSVVKSENNITLNAVGVVDEQVADRSTVWDEVHADTLGRDSYFMLVYSSCKGKVVRVAACCSITHSAMRGNHILYLPSFSPAVPTADPFPAIVEFDTTPKPPGPFGRVD